MLSFTGSNAVITGGANGIGLACAKLLASGGAHVWILDRERADGFDCLPCDVSDPASIEAAFARLPDPDIAIANAGMCDFVSFLDTPRQLWDRTIAVNLSGAFHTMQQAARRMAARRRGAIVLTASTNSYDGEPEHSAYNASKAGLLGLLHTAANELGAYGVRVNAVCPGLIRTRLTNPAFEQEAVMRDYFRDIPLGRGGRPEEVAAAVAFLASGAASYITGAALLVDGGQMASKFGVWREPRARFVHDHWELA